MTSLGAKASKSSQCVMSKKGVRYFDSDFEFSELLEIGLAFDRKIVEMSEDDVSKEVEDVSKEEEEEEAYGEVWEKFHVTMGSKFFPRKRYVPLAFPEIGGKEEIGGEDEKKGKRRRVFALGCGTGSSILAILKYWDHVHVGCVDVSRKAVDVFLNRCKEEDLSSRVLDAEVFDLVGEEKVPRSILSHVPYDVFTLIFVLSAIRPKDHVRVLQRARSLGPKGLLCFRDYGLYDMTMLRSKKHQVVKVEDAKSPPRLFRRADGTLRYFFSLDYVRSVFKKAGWDCVRMDYSRVVNKNRRTGQELRRVFVTAVFRAQT